MLCMLSPRGHARCGLRFKGLAVLSEQDSALFICLEGQWPGLEGVGCASPLQTSISPLLAEFISTKKYALSVL